MRASVACFVLLAGCSTDPGATLLVEVQTDWVPGLEFRSVRVALVAVTTGSEEEVDSSAIEVAGGLEDEAAFRRGARLGDFANVVAGDYRVSVELRAADGSLVAQRSQTLTVGSDSRGALVVLHRTCGSVSCPGVGPAELSACVDGLCANPACGSGGGAVCPPTVCTDAAECTADRATCADVVCTSEGRCLITGDSSNCTSGACHPVDGCTSVVMVDGGPTDAGGLPDASVDASVDAGLTGWNPDLDPALIAHYRLDDADPIAGIVDSSPAAVAAACVTPTCPLPTSGRLGGALTFANEAVGVPHHAGFDAVTTGFTIMAWVRPPDPTGAGPRSIVTKTFGTATRNTWHLLLTDLGGSYEASLVVARPDSSFERTDAPLPGVVDWVHVAASWNGVRLLVWVNGVQTMGTASITSVGLDAGEFLIGCDENDGTYANFFRGAIDDVRLYSRALSTAEIAAIVALPDR